MSALSELPEIVGFFSYSREDDADSAGALSALRDRIQRELRGRLGRTKANFRLWQDTAAIPQGALWEDEIKSAIAQSVFFIPIITPTTVKSPHCKREFELFLGREAELHRRDLIFPLLYIRVPELEDERLWRQDEVLSVIGSRQYIDWQERRYLDVNSTEVAKSIGRFCSNIYDALRQPSQGPHVFHDRDDDVVEDEAGAVQSPQNGGSSRSIEQLRIPVREQDRSVTAEAEETKRPGRRESRAGVDAASDKAESSRRWLAAKAALQYGLVALVGALAVAVFVLWRQASSPIPSPPLVPVPPGPTPPPAPESVIRRSAAFGGNGGNPFDDTSANPGHLPITGVTAIVTLNPASATERIIGRLQTRWGDTDGPLHGGGPANIPTTPARFAAGETISKIFILHKSYTWALNEAPPVWIAGLQIQTNKGFYNFGYTDGPADVCVPLSGEIIIGFFGRSGSYIDQLGCVFAKRN